MGIFRYIVQGIGWEIGRHAAREGIDAVANAQDGTDAPIEQPPSPREQRRAERAARVTRKRQAAELERQLQELKRKARQS
jgi:hypothetical protein